MSLLAGGFAPQIQELFGSGLTPRAGHLYARNETSSTISSATRTAGSGFLTTSSQSSSTATGVVVNMFLDSIDEDMEIAGSIVEVCAGTTVYALRCTAAPTSGGSQFDMPGLGGSQNLLAACAPDAPMATLTANPSTYLGSASVSTSTAGQSAQVTVKENCNLGGTTAATCTGSISISGGGVNTATAVTATYTGADYHRHDVLITAGAEKTASPAATCARPNSAASVKGVTVWGLLGLSALVGMVAL